MGEISKLQGLGPAAEKSLNAIGIYTKKDLEEIGAVNALMKLERECNFKPHLNFLYAMVGALENKSWLEIAKTERERLIYEIEGYKELEKLENEEGLSGII